LPVSVLVGLALLPFGIPLLWWAAPTITGKEATLSLAVPVSLAIAASTLCLGVVYTIDWTGTTRIKGVLMLVCLAYLSAAGLYFLKKDMLDRLRGLFEPGTRWKWVQSDEGFLVRMPAPIDDAKDSPIPRMRMTGKKAMFLTESDDKYQYLAVAGAPEKPVPNQDPAALYDTIGKHLAVNGKITDDCDVKLFRTGHPGHQWTVQIAGNVRVVQVYVDQGRVYYLSVEGRNLKLSDKEVEPFFKSFEILNANANR
jgi:hypothetical protein